MSNQRRVEIRVPAHLVEPLRSSTAWTNTRESVAFGLVSHACLSDRTLLLVRRLVPLPNDAYMTDSGHGAKWPGRAMLPVLNEAIAQQAGVVVFHSHPHAGPVSLSADDRTSAGNLLPTFETVVPLRPHASIVLGSDHAAGIVAFPDDSDHSTAVRVRLLGQALIDLPSDEWPFPHTVGREEFDRQELLTGGDGEAALRRSRIAVVGLSGGGSHAVQQLAHMGVGEIIGIDGDRAEKSNRSRLIGMEWLDAVLRRRKTRIMARLVRHINASVKFTGVAENIPTQAAMDAFKRADIVIGCVDTYHARADLQELAWRYLIPYVDIGLLIRQLDPGMGVTIGGNVIPAIPGNFCQWCFGFLSDEKLSAEPGNRPRSYLENSDRQPQVVSMNGLLASQAVNEVLQLLTGFAPVSEDRSIKKYNGLEGTLESWLVKKSDSCVLCSQTLGAGDPVWNHA